MLRAEVQLDRAAFLRAVGVVLLGGAIALLMGWLGWIVRPLTEHRRKSLWHEILPPRQDAGLVPELGTTGTARATPDTLLDCLGPRMLILTSLVAIFASCAGPTTPVKTWDR